MNFTPFAFIQNPIVLSIPPNPASSSQAFITAANITNPTQQTAITNLVADLYSYSLWDKMTAIYPFVGGNATSHKFNLKNPIDSDEAYRISFFGGWTHNSNGIQGDGVSSYANTNAYTKTTAIPNRANHWSLYIKQRPFTDPSYMGVFDYPGGFTFFGIAATNGNNIGLGLQSLGFYNSPAIPSSNGFYNGTIQSFNGILYFNGAEIATASPGNFSNEFPYYIGAMYLEGAANYNNDGLFSFASLGNNLTAADAANYYTAVQAFQTTLGRQV